MIISLLVNIMVPAALSDAREQHTENLLKIKELENELKAARTAASTAKEQEQYFKEQSERWSQADLFTGISFFCPYQFQEFNFNASV